MYLKFLILYLKFYFSNTEMISFDDNETQQMNNEIVQNIHEEFEYDNCLIVTYQDATKESSELFQFINSKTIINNKYFETILSKKLIKYHAYIIIIETINDISNYFDAMQINIDKKAKYLVVSQNEMDPVEIFEIAIKIGILNLNILINNEMYTHFPYAEGKCGNNSKAIQIITENTQLNSSLMQGRFKSLR